MSDPEPVPARRRGRRPDLDHETERRRLLRAALAVLQRNGDHQVTLNEILREANLSTRAFYRQFSSTSEVLTVLREDELARLLTLLDKAIAEAPTPQAALEAWIDGLLGIRFDPRRARRVSVVRDSSVVNLQARIECIDALAPGLQRLLEDGKAAGAFPRADPAADALTICGMAIDFTASRPDPRRPASRDEVRDHVLRFALGGLT